MGLNRILGAPFQPTIVNTDTTTQPAFDLYLVDAEFGNPVTITLDPYAVQGDRVRIQDIANNAATQPIAVVSSDDQTILNGYGSSLTINANGGGVILTFDQERAAWIPSTLASSASSGPAPGTAAYNPSWYALTDIYWDPAGTVGGSDTNSGAEGAPILTWAELIRRYGSVEPIIPYGQSVRVHMLTPQPFNQDPVFLEPMLSGGGTFAIIGTLTVFALAFVPATITQPVKVAGGTPLKVSGMPAGVTAGMWVINETTQGAAFVDSVIGGVATMQQPYTLDSFTVVSLAMPAQDNAWATGNTLTIYDPPPNINLKRFSPKGIDVLSATSGCVGWAQYLSIADTSGTGLSFYAHACTGIAMNVLSGCIINPRLQLDEPVGRLAQAGLYGCWMTAGNNGITGGHGDIFGGAFLNGVMIYSAVYVEGTYFHGTSLIYGIGVLLAGQYSDGTIELYGGNVELNNNPLWGTFSIQLYPGSRLWVNKGTFETMMMTSGALTFGGATTSGWTVSGATLTPNVSLTLANIDSNGAIFDLKTGAGFSVGNG